MLLVSLHTYVSHVALKKGSKAIVGEIHDPDSNPLRLPSACAFQVGVGGERAFSCTRPSRPSLGEASEIQRQVGQKAYLDDMSLLQ